MDLRIVAAFAGFGAVALLFVVIQDYAVERRQLRRTIRGIEGPDGEPIPSIRGQQLDVNPFRRVLVPSIRRLGRLVRKFTPLDVYDRLEQELVYAGNPAGWDAERVIVFKFVLPIVLAPLGYFMAAAAGFGDWRQWVVTALFAAVGWYGPEWILRSRSGQRQRAIQRELPDSLDLLSITVEAGLAFDGALTRVARNVKGPLGQELYRVVQEMQLGKGRADALRDLAERSNVQDLRVFVGAMVQADVFGIPIARVLKVQAREMRIRRRQRAEEQAQKLPVKIVFPVVLTIFPSIFVVLLGPAAIQIYDALL